jgi:hypothetical protein
LQFAITKIVLNFSAIGGAITSCAANFLATALCGLSIKERDIIAHQQWLEDIRFERSLKKLEIKNKTKRFNNYSGNFDFLKLGVRFTLPLGRKR